MKTTFQKYLQDFKVFFSRLLFSLGVIGAVTTLALKIAASVSPTAPSKSVSYSVSIGISFLFIVLSVIFDRRVFAFLHRTSEGTFLALLNKFLTSNCGSVLFLSFMHTFIFLPLFIRGRKGPFLAGTDGETMQLDNALSHAFSYPALAITNNPLQGLGSNQQWIYNYKLDPGYQLLYFLGTKGFAASHWFWILALSLSVLVIVRTLKFNTWLAIPTALAVPYLLLSSNSYSLTLTFLIAPHNLYSIAVSNTIVALLVRKDSNQTRYVTKIILVNLLFLYLVLLNTPYIPIVFPILMVALAFHVLERKSSPSKLRILFLCALLQFLLFLPFVFGLFLDSAAYVFRDEYQPVEFSLKHASALFNFERKPSILIYIFGILSTLNFALSSKSTSTQKMLARITISTVCLNLLYSLLWVNLEFLRKGIRPLYFEFFIWSFVLIFSFAFVGKVIKSFTDDLLSSALKVLPSLMSFLICINALLLTFSEYERRMIPPKRIPVFDNQLDKIRLEPNSEFRGRLLILFGNFDHQVSVSKKLYKELGNDFQRTMVWSKGIPTLNEFGHHISPLSYFAISNSFMRGNPAITRNILVYNTYNEKLADLFGIRFIISDVYLNDSDLKLKGKIFTNMSNVYLYERRLVSNGISLPYKPIELTQSKSVFSLMKDDLFNNNVHFFVKRLNASMNKLEPASDVSLSLAPGGYRVKAQSKSSSLIVLPLEYSHCFSLEDQDAQLIQVNGSFLGIVFQKNLDTSLSYINSPFTNSYCRIRNFLDAQGLKDLD